MFLQVSPWASISETHAIEHIEPKGRATTYVALRRPRGDRTTAVELGRYESFNDAAAACREDARTREQEVA